MPVTATFKLNAAHTMRCASDHLSLDAALLGAIGIAATEATCDRKLFLQREEEYTLDDIEGRQVPTMHKQLH